ncbi:MAG TPA: efflux RND transporter periplasmic adaptor subunit [Cellvibrio sp.]|nr:efflux RND transporter periplasmic adaptor subunit [Cellvibrio sp.]
MPSVTGSFKLWLSIQCQMLGNVSTAMLMQTPVGDQPRILAKWPSAEINNPSLHDAFSQVIEKGRLQLVPDGDGHFILGQPLVIDGKHWGVLLLRVQLADKKELPSVLKQLKLGQYWLQFLLHQPAANVSAATIPSAVQAPEKNSTAATLLQLSASLLKENSVQETAISLVNLLSGFLQATRVSLGLYQENTIYLEAISFSANFDQRTQAMQAISEAMREAVEQGVAIDFTATPFFSPSAEANAPTLITRAHQQLQQLQHLQSVHSLLVRTGEVIVGVLTVELDRNTVLTQDERDFLQQALHFAGAILSLRQQASASVWDGLKRRTGQRLERWLGAESWRRKIISIMLLVFVVALFVPIEYRIAADATLQTTEKYLVVSPQDGYLGKINARPGDTVQKGALLAQLKDEDLRLERQKLASQVQQYRQSYDAALANSDRVAAAIASAQMDQANIQLRMVDQQLERTQLNSPLDGIVVSDDISQTQGAPVKQGDVLFEIAAAQGFLVQLYVDERDIAAVQTGQQGQVKFSSLPGEMFAVRVNRITPISMVREGRNYFRVDVELARELDTLRPGMTGTGKLIAGRRALGWIWFHDLWHWLRLKLW